MYLIVSDHCTFLRETAVMDSGIHSKMIFNNLLSANPKTFPRENGDVIRKIRFMTYKYGKYSLQLVFLMAFSRQSVGI